MFGGELEPAPAAHSVEPREAGERFEMPDLDRVAVATVHPRAPGLGGIRSADVHRATLMRAIQARRVASAKGLTPRSLSSHDKRSHS